MKEEEGEYYEDVNEIPTRTYMWTLYYRRTAVSASSPESCIAQLTLTHTNLLF